MGDLHSYARILIVLVLLSLIGCAEQETVSDDLDGAIIVWHTWPEPESLIIEDELNRFDEVHPNVTVVTEYVPLEDLQKEFEDTVTAGLGPDLLIGVTTRQLSQFVDQNLLADMTGTVDINELSAQAVNALRFNSLQYGIPFAGSTPVLYFNRSMVSDPPTTLAEFDNIAAEGQTIAIPTDFRNSYWGITTFGGEVLKGGEVAVNDNFADWLTWLVSVAGQPHVVLDHNYVDLQQLFAEGDVSYFIGNSLDLPYLREVLGEENLGVAELPSNGDTPAGAFFELETLAVSRVSAEQELASRLIEFMTNAPHQREIALGGTGRVPVNRLVRIDSRFSPDAHTLLVQSRKSTILPLQYGIVSGHLLNIGDKLYNQVLEGVVLPEDAGAILIENVNLALAPSAE